MDKPYIIIGMHRSGTTLLSKAFDDAGIFQGVFRDHNNEAFHFLSINQQVLQKANYTWLEPGIPSKEDWFSITPEELISEHYKVQTRNRLKQRLTLNHYWGWKDPRNTFTLDMWLAMFPKARVIHVIRDGRDVAMSLASRNKIAGEIQDERINSLTYNFKLWEKYVSQADSFKLGPQTFLEVRYESLIGLETETIKQLNRFCHKNIGAALKKHIIHRSKKKYPQELIDIAEKSNAFKKWYKN